MTLRIKLALWVALLLCSCSMQATPMFDVMNNADVQQNDSSKDLSILNSQININSATVRDWISIKGVGPKKAAAIIEYREMIGGFKSIDELMGVRGIGQKALAKMRPMLKL